MWIFSLSVKFVISFIICATFLFYFITMFSSKANKNDSKSFEFKELGNQCYTNKDYREAIIFYNKALCYAESNLQLSFLYANRSAAYIELKLYKECLKNIQLAKDLGYPKGKMEKLAAREEKCKGFLILKHDKVNKNEDIVKSFFKLSYKCHPTIPFIIEGIELRRSEEFGRYLITTRNLKAGDIIAIDEPFLKSLSKGHVIKFERCARCLLENNLNFIPCEKCNERKF
jgi:SET and MYND domain-containing protein 4